MQCLKYFMFHIDVFVGFHWILLVQFLLLSIFSMMDLIFEIARLIGDLLKKICDILLYPYFEICSKNYQ